jgi:hypothetical protein
MDDEVRSKMGYDPLPNPHVIQELAPDDAAPALIEFEDREELEFENPPASPLLALGQQGQAEPKPAAESAKPLDKLPELVVWGANANFRGKETELTNGEQAAIAKIILGAVTRSIRGQLKEVSALTPRRAYTRRAAEAAEPAKRKRGRPRKEDPSTSTEKTSTGS